MSETIKKLDRESSKTLEHFKKELGRIRTGRASPTLLDGLHVDYYGSSVPLVQLGNINAPEPRLLTIQVYDAGACESIEKAILQSDLGINPSREGSLIRISIPQLNEERRKEFIKKVHKLAEENKVTIRNHRRDAIDDLKKREKDKTVSADDVRKGQEEIQKIVVKYSKEIDTAVLAKEKEIMEV